MTSSECQVVSEIQFVETFVKPRSTHNSFRARNVFLGQITIEMCSASFSNNKNKVDVYALLEMMMLHVFFFVFFTDV